MKKNKPALGGILLLLTLFVSCHKIDELRYDLQNGNADLKQCVIKEIDFQFSTELLFGATQLKFTYNSKKDPVTMTPDFIDDGSPIRVFYYDKAGRLTQFAGIFPNGAFEFWHNYFYDRSDRIVGDSLYTLGRIGQLGGASIKAFSQLSYDHLNRITREIKTSNALNPDRSDTTYFQYDAAGNLNGGQGPYDHNVNPLLTNKIWRFLDRDYSVNNSIQATAYDEHRLPILYSNNLGGHQMELFEYNIQPALGLTLQYDCTEGLIPGY